MRRTSTPFLSMIAVGMLSITAGLLDCAGKTARGTAGVSSLVYVWDGSGDVDVEGDVRNGIATLPADQQTVAQAALAAFSAGMASKDRATMAAECLPRWPSLRLFAETGIQARVAGGGLSPAAGDSKRERLRQFDRLLTRVTTEAMP